MNTCIETISFNGVEKTQNRWFQKILIITCMLVACLSMTFAQNNDPVITSTAVTAVNDDVIYSYALAATDVDGDIVTFTATTKPSWLSIQILGASSTVNDFVGNGGKSDIDGTGNNAQIRVPNGIVIDGNDNLYVTSGGGLRKITPAGVMTTITNGVTDNANGVTIDGNGDFFIVTNNHVIKKVTAAGVVSDFAGLHGTLGFADGTGSVARFHHPTDIVINSSGDFYVSDLANNKIRKVTSAGVVSTIATVTSPKGLAIDQADNIYVISGHAVMKITGESTVSLLAGDVATNGDIDDTGSAARFNGPKKLTINSGGNIYVSEQFQNRIRQITPTGVVTTAVSMQDPLGMIFDSSGNLFVAANSHHVKKVTLIIGTATLTGDPAGQAGVHNVVLTASDGNGGTATQNFTVTVSDTSTPVFTSATAVSFAERGTGTAYTAVATDGNALTYSLGTTKDESLFNIDGTNGVVSFKSAPDFETPGDGNTDNVYEVEVKANDGANEASQTVSITVTDVNENPVFTSGTAVNFAENGTGTAYTAIAVVIDNGAITYSLGTAKDESLFNIDGTSGGVTFKSAPDFETPGDGNTDNVYEVEVKAHEGANETSQTVSIRVTNLNDNNPVFTSAAVTAVNNDATYNYAPAATDADGDHVTFTATTKPSWLSIQVSGAGSTVNDFVGNGGKSEIDGTGTNAQLRVPDGVTIDVNDNVYVTSGGGLRKITPAAVMTTITNSVTDNANGVTIDGNGDFFIVTSNHVIKKVTAAGVVSNFAGQEHSLGFADGTGTDARFFNPEDIAINNSGDFYVSDMSNNKIRKVTSAGVVSTIATVTQPQGMTVDQAGNIYVISGNAVLKITGESTVSVLAGDVSAKNDYVDATGTAARFSRPRKLTVKSDGNTYVSEENRIRKITPSGVVTTAVNISSPQGMIFDSSGNLFVASNSHRVYKVTFINGTATLTGDPSGQGGVHNVVLTASDGNGGTATQNFTVTVSDLTVPVFTSATTANFAENGTGTAYTALATDDSALTYSLGTTKDESLFNIDGTSGAVTFKSAPDFETPGDGNTDNVYEVEVKANDGTNEASQTVSITVTDIVDEVPPVFTSATTANFAENGTVTAYTVAATDANAITYSLGTGNDEALFNIVSGVVTFKTSPDFEAPTDGNTDNAYVINVIASDGINSANQDVTITVTDVDEIPPVYTSATTANFVENGTGTAYSVVATDANQVTYALGTGNDEALFNINGGTVTFKNAPDFEAPADGNTDNAYVIEVQANDGLNTAMQTVTITVTDVDEIDPVFTSGTSVNFAENGTGTAYSVAATDANQVTYALGTGNDEALFNINGAVVTFKNAPDFEAPADGNTDNAYVIEVQANDGLNTAMQTVTITVTDVDEIDPVFTSGTAVNFAENGTGTAYTIAATDANPLTYTLGTGNDEGLFNINGAVVTFKNAPDFEAPADGNTDNVYMILVKATDGLNEVSQMVSVTVTNLDDSAPVFTSSTTAGFAENGTGTAYTAMANDASPFVFGLGTGNDEALFNINANTGAITFKTVPDFENPHDGNTDNTYIISITATDIHTNSSSQLVTINVTNLDEVAPIIISLDPLDETTISANQTLRVTFDNLVFKGTGMIRVVKESNGDLVQQIDVNSAAVLIDGNAVSIDPPVDLPVGEDLAVLFDGTTISDEAGNDITGVFNTSTWNHTVTGADLTAPKLIDLTPKDGSTVQPQVTITATFSENVFANQGRMRIYRKSDLLLLRERDIHSNDIVINGTKVSLQLPPGLALGEEVIIHFSPSSLTDASGNEMGPVFDDNTWNLTPQADNAPSIVTLSPTDGATANPGNNLTVTFNEPVAKGTGKVRLYKKSDLTLLDEVDITDPSITVNGSAVSFNLPGTLPLGQEIIVHFAGSALQDVGGNDISGLFNNDTWNLNIVADPAPVISSLSPVDGGSFVPGDVLTLTLNENVSKNSGKVRIYRSSDLTVLAEIDVTSSNVQVNGNVITVTTPANIPTSESIFVHFSPSTFLDGGANDLTGLFDAETWNLTTVADPAPTISVLSPTDGGNLNQGFNLSVTFSESVFKSSGKIRFYRSSDVSLISEMNINDSRVVINGAQVTITPPGNLPGNVEFFVHFSGSSLIDSRNNDITGVFTATTWNLTLLPDAAPTIVSLSPADGSNVTPGSTATVTFSENVFKASGKVRIYKKSDLSLIKLIDINSPGVTVNGAAVSVRMPGNLPIGEEILIHFSPTSLEDSGGNDLTGLFTVDTWNLIPLADPSPTISSLSPVDGANTVQGATFTATFSEAIFKSSGKVRIYKKSDLSLLSTIDITSGTISVSGSTLSFNLPAGLPTGEELLIHLSKTALVDAGGNNITGLFTIDTWNFTIPDPAPTVNSDFTQLNKDLLGLNEIVLTIYPNPTEGKFTIDLNEVVEVEQFVIYNTSGVAVIIETDKKQRRIEVDLTNESNGIYLINVQLKGRILKGKVLVRR